MISKPRKDSETAHDHVWYPPAVCGACSSKAAQAILDVIDAWEP